MRELNDAARSRSGIGATGGRSLDTKGFSGNDMTLLQQTHQAGMANRGWGRGQFVTTGFAQYLAIWDSTATIEAPPRLSIIRFDKTGTYALLIGGTIVANGKTLGPVLAALPSDEATTNDA